MKWPRFFANPQLEMPNEYVRSARIIFLGEYILSYFTRRPFQIGWDKTITYQFVYSNGRDTWTETVSQARIITEDQQ